jgi:hypothetical protein
VLEELVWQRLRNQRRRQGDYELDFAALPRVAVFINLIRPATRFAIHSGQAARYKGYALKGLALSGRNYAKQRSGERRDETRRHIIALRG